MKKWMLTVGVLFLVWTLSAQTEDTQDKVRRQRISRIDFYHVSVGADFAVNRNFCVGAQLSVGVGSFRNVLNVDAGLRYRFLGMFPSMGAERLALHQLPVFVSLNVNPLR